MSKAWNVIINKIKDFEMNKGLCSFVNPYSMLLLEEHPDIASQIDNWYIDGISLVNKLNSRFQSDHKRVSFDNTSIAPIVFKHVKENNLKLAIIGTKEEHIGKAITNIEKNFDVKVSYFRNGYFKSKKEKNDCITSIINNDIDVVVAGMGTPHQERFLIDLKSSGWTGYGFTCGGYLHQIAKSDKYYPTFFDKYNIRWLYRIIDEPKLLRRYGLDYPIFFIKFNKFLKK